MTTRTVLRVKRHRSATPAASMIRLDVLGGFQLPGEEEKDGQHHSAIWKLVSSSAKGKNPEKVVQAANGIDDFDSTPNKRCHVLDAVMDEEQEEDSENQARCKRRRLKLVDTVEQTSSSLRKTEQLSYRVLDPTTRLVDDSLQRAHAGSISAGCHYSFVTTDPRLARNARKWLLWNHQQHGNILHVCAHWNDVELAYCLLQRPDLPHLAEQTDSDGHTPYEIAHLTGHHDIINALQACGADTSNYVYDIFIHDPNDHYVHPNPRTDSMMEEKEELPDPVMNSFDPMPFELRGGVGYWTTEGEFMLEKDQKNSNGYADLPYSEEEDIDSNCEDYGGNDYPDEHDEFWDNDFYPGERYDEYEDIQEGRFHMDYENDDEPPLWG